MDLVEIDALVGGDVLLGVLRHREDPWHPLRDPGLHLGEGVPATLAEFLPRGAGVFEFELAVDRDRVVNRLEDRPLLLVELEDAPPEGLVVLDQVEVVAAGAQLTPDAPAERHRFGEGARRERQVFEGVGPVLPFPQPGLAHRVWVGPDVEARQRVERDALVDDGVGRPGVDLDMVAEVDESFGEVAAVDTLAADVRLASVGEVRDPERCVGVGGRPRHRASRLRLPRGRLRPVRGLVQRVSRATVTVEGVSGGREMTGEIGAGILVFVGVTHDDTEAHAAKLADKIWNLRIFDDADGVMNRSAADEGHEVLVVSQFTLYGDTRKGRRPGYSEAARPEQAEPLVETVVEALRAAGAVVATGRFRADMAVELVNDGPITLWIEV